MGTGGARQRRIILIIGRAAPEPETTGTVLGLGPTGRPCSPTPPRISTHATRSKPTTGSDRDRLTPGPVTVLAPCPVHSRNDSACASGWNHGGKGRSSRSFLRAGAAGAYQPPGRERLCPGQTFGPFPDDTFLADPPPRSPPLRPDETAPRWQIQRLGLEDPIAPVEIGLTIRVDRPLTPAGRWYSDAVEIRARSER